MAQIGGITLATVTVTSVRGHFLVVVWDSWVNTMALTSFVLSMAVNTLMTGLIVFKILKVFLEVKATMTSVEQTLGSTGGTKLRHVIFVIIESGMVLFAIQLFRVMILTLDGGGLLNLIAVVTHQMFIVIIRSVHSYFFCFTDNIYLARASHQQ